jgi:hypothetical protein
MDIWQLRGWSLQYRGSKGESMNSQDCNLDEMIMQLWETGFFKDNVDPRKIEVELYPYTTLKNTIRKRQDRVLIRISDMLWDAPGEIIWALIIVLFCKLENRLPPKSQLLAYKEYANSKKMRRRIRTNRKSRVKKDLMGPKGKHYDLNDSFLRVNGKYFQGELKKPILSWSKKRTRSRFGHHDEALDTIIISKTLDDKNVPRFLLDYIMYHEALHIKHKTKFRNGRRRMHTRAFSEDEKRFSKRDRAEQLLKKLSKEGSLRK